MRSLGLPVKLQMSAGWTRRSVRRGERPLAEVLDAVSDTEARLAQLGDSPAIGVQPDRAWVDDWLHRSYLNFWARDH